MKRSVAVVLSAAVLACALPAAAARVRRLSLDEIRDRAGVIVVGEVIGSSTRFGKADMVWTDYQVRVSETLKGDNQPAVKTISFAGGKVGDYGVGIDGVPELEHGASYVFFLKADPGLMPMPSLGWGQGIYRVQDVDLNGAKKQTLISVDGEPLEVNAQGQLVRGHSVQVVDGVVREASVANTNRIAPSAVIRADGSLAPANPSVMTRAMAAPQHRFATLGQLRDFVAGKIASGERAAK